jgi:phosphatidylglycerophosphate synthase
MMARTGIHLIRDTRTKLILVGSLGAFMRSAVIGALGVVVFALTLPGAAPATITTAVAFYVAAAAVTGWFLKRDYPYYRLGLCNTVTLGRLVLVCALLVPLIAGSESSWTFFAIATLALSLDGIDGWLARRQGLESAFGARFDVEIDSLLALVLALNAAFNTDTALAVLLLGVPRYAFLIAAVVLPWMRGALPERFSRKAVCVVQLATLIAMQAPILPPEMAAFLLPVAAIAVIWSFTIDIAFLWQSSS